jgi:hypothetical protein
LYRVEEQLKLKGKSIRDYVDFYAGTSTGSIIALALATTKLSIKEINNFYYDRGNIEQIFSDNRGLFEIDGLNAPKYEGLRKKNTLKARLGEAKISDVPQGKHVLAVTYSVEKCCPKVIKSTDENCFNLLSYEVADASSAAPTFFPTTEVQTEWLIDGGVIANNPTMCAIAEARRIWKDQPLEEMRILSIGTGYRTRKVNGLASQKWGAAQWFIKGDIVSVLQDERIVAYQAMVISGSGKYIRVNIEMRKSQWLPNPPDDAMDDISQANLQKLKEMGNFWFEKYGKAVIELLMNEYKGLSLDRIDLATGEPIQVPNRSNFSNAT